MNKGKLCTAEEYPDKVEDGVTVKVGLHTATEGPDSITSDLDILKAERNTDNGNTEGYADNKVDNCHPEAVNQEPNEIAY